MTLHAARSLLLGLLVLSPMACKDRAPNEIVLSAGQRRGEAARNARSLGMSQLGERGIDTRVDTKNQEPFVRTRGYLVRGTDEASFKICGEKEVHFLRPSPAASGRILQRYRFKSPTLLYPVFFVVNGRSIDDTVKVGDYTYTKVLEVSSVFPDSLMEKPSCAAPPRGSLMAAK